MQDSSPKLWISGKDHIPEMLVGRGHNCMDMPYSLPCDEMPGMPSDLAFLEEDAWLADSVVIPFVFCRHKQWHIWLIFVWRHDPLRLLCRRGGVCGIEAQAHMQAQLLTRGAARDARGRLKLNHDVFRFCDI